MDFVGALPYCGKAVELNGNDAANWLDFAEVLYVTGDVAKERNALKQAVAADPMTPEVAWNASNLYLLQGDVPTALDLLTVVLKGDPALVPIALKTSWRAIGKVQPILDRLPPDPTAYLEFVGLLASENKEEEAALVWTNLMLLNQQIDYKGAVFYIDDLLGWKKVGEAREAWKQLARHSDDFQTYQPKDGNLIINGSFEHDVLNSGFDWRTVGQGTKITLDDDSPKSGSRSALVTYRSPVLDSGLFQLVPVSPNTRYQASAWLKTDELQTANGPRFALTDAYSGAVLGAAQPVAYTTPWMQVMVEFMSGPDTHLVAVRLIRDRQDTVIRGRLWIDDVEFHSSSSQRPAH